MNNEKIIIIGAGAAGLATAITLGRAGKTVLLFEKNSRAGKKILVSGNGKCNITNQKISTMTATISQTEENWIEYINLLQQSQLQSKDAFELSEALKESWWKANRETLLKKIGQA